MRMLAALAAALFLTSSADALSTGEANKIVEGFVAAPGYTAFDVDTIHDEGSPYEKNFPKSGEGATHADAMIGPIEKALLLVNSYEETKPDRVRYAISYSQVSEDADGNADTIMLVEVRRYNLGPIIRKYAMEEYGPENTAGPEDFGVGPDVAWRFAFGTVMGNTSLALSGSRHVIAEGDKQMKEDDAAEICVTGPCRSVVNGVMEFMPKGDPEPIEAAALTAPYTTAFGKDDMMGISAPFVARNLQAFLGVGDGGDWANPETPEAGKPGEPFLMVQIDQNLGQEIVSAGLAGFTLANDDAIAAKWVRATFWNGQPPSDAQIITVGR